MLGGGLCGEIGSLLGERRVTFLGVFEELRMAAERFFFSYWVERWFVVVFDSAGCLDLTGITLLTVHMGGGIKSRCFEEDAFIRFC